jgi:hypothetical protein
MNVNIIANYSILASGDSQNLKNEGFYYGGSLNLRYTIWKNCNLSAFGYYSSQRVMIQGKSGSYWFSSINLSQDLFKKKLTASVSVTDPFRSRMKMESSMKDPTFNSSSVSYAYRQMARFSLSWRFGQMKGEIKKAKRSIKNEDVKAGEESSSGTGSSAQ